MPLGLQGSWQALLLGCLLPLCLGEEQPSVAVLRIISPESLAQTVPAYFASFSAPETPPGPLRAWPAPADPMGCDSYEPPLLVGWSGGIAVVRRGNCTFVRKAENAAKAGADGILVVSDSDYVQIMGAGNDTDARSSIMTLGITKSLGDKILDWEAKHRGDEHGSDHVVMEFEIYKPSAMNFSELLMVLLGTCLVAAGAYFSTSDLSKRGSFQEAVQAPQEEVMEVDYWLAIGFFVIGSCFLVVLYFFMKYLIYFIIFAFCMGGFNTLWQMGSIFLTWVSPPLKQEALSIPQVGPFAKADLLAGVPAFAMVVAWFVLRKSSSGWFFQDVIGAGFLCWLQRTLRLPNIRIATLFLCIMFCFDIFWVFISPLLFQGHSVMVTVATGGETHERVPMLLRLPAIGDPFGNDRMLGFGDIALPGLLVSFLRRHDVLSRRTLFSFEGYFGPVLIGYFFGLIATIIALEIMHQGQPALLYLVPGTLGTTVVRALYKGELQHLWDGRPCPNGSKVHESASSSSSSSSSASTSP